jgi:hypothetical protein
MKPVRSILDKSFSYVPSFATSIASTWRRAGWRPTTDEDRKARQQQSVLELIVDSAAADASLSARRIAKKVANGPW